MRSDIINLGILTAFKGQLIILIGLTFFNVEANKKILLFCETLLNLIFNFITYETGTCDD